MKIQKVFCIDLDSACPEVMELSGKELEKDLRYAKTSDPLKVGDYDRKVFRTEKGAEKYLNRYKAALKGLKRLSDGGWMPGPSLIYKRHYLVQTSLGEKMQTFRDYEHDWPKGQVIKLYDQTYFLLVKLRRITKTSTGFKYEFSVVKKK